MTRSLQHEWLDIAERVLGVARHLFELYHPMPLEIICYHCQQSAEKAFKAFYIALGIPGGVPRTHDLSLLLDQMHNATPIDDSLYDLADMLTPYGTAARYPGGMNFSEYNTQKALQTADAIVAWVKDCIEPTE